MVSFRKRENGLALQSSDRQWLSAHKNVQWYWSGSAERPGAYAAIGRGIDLQNIVHEWGGNAAELRALLGAIHRDHPEAVLLGPPALLRKYGFETGSAAPEFLALVRILDPARVFQSYHPLTPFTAKSLEDGWEINIQGISIPSFSESELARFFFGPGSPSMGSMGGSDTPLFPLPLWIWGLDSA
jgi:hypothetical protein